MAIAACLGPQLASVLLLGITWPPLISMCQTDKCVVAQGLKVVLIINLIIIDHLRMTQAFRFIEISKYDDGGQLMSAAKLCLDAVDIWSYGSTSNKFVQLLGRTRRNLILNSVINFL